MYEEADLLPLSGLQHLAFCERQWGLIHIEQSWEENRLTAEGRVLHDKVDEPHYETREGMRLVRALPLRCLRLGLSGRADLVEFPVRRSAGGPPVPVEFKRGRPKRVDADDVQLCAQALCLEEMTGESIAVGFLYYHQTRHRHEVPIDQMLRSRVERLAARMHELHAKGVTPRAERAPKCAQCSLVELCQPDWLGAKKDPWRRWQALVRKGIEP
jgi:CRISPR-associated exonuclease Cas4